MMLLEESHTGVYLAEQIINRLKEYDIELIQIFTITTDNGKNVLKMVRDMEEHLRIEIDKAKASACEVSQDTNNVSGANATYQVQSNELIGDETAEAVEMYLAEVTEITDDEAMELVMDEVVAMEKNKTLLSAMTVHLGLLGADFLFDITGVNCAEHTLQLSVGDATNGMKLYHKNVIKLCTEASKMLRLQSTINEMDKVGISYKLPRLENKTRWGSMFLMVSHSF